MYVPVTNYSDFSQDMSFFQARQKNTKLSKNKTYSVLHSFLGMSTNVQTPKDSIKMHIPIKTICPNKMCMPSTKNSLKYKKLLYTCSSGLPLSSNIVYIIREATNVSRSKIFQDFYCRK